MFGSIDLVCHLDDELKSLWYEDGVMSMTTNRGVGSLHIPRDVDIRLAGDIKAERIEFTNHLINYFTVRNYDGAMRVKKIKLEIYPDNVVISLKD